MDIFSELNRAQAENIATDPAPSIKGRFYYKNASEPLKIDDGTSIHKVITDLNYEGLLSKYAPSVDVGESYRNVVTSTKAWNYNSEVQDRVTYTGVLPIGDLAYSVSIYNTSTQSHPFYIRKADFPSLNGVSSKFRITVNLHTNSTNITSEVSVSLFSVTRIAPNGVQGSEFISFGPGVPVAGSNVTSFTSPGAYFSGSKVSLDFDIPLDGFYIMGISGFTNIIPDASGRFLIDATLQTRNA